MTRPPFTFLSALQMFGKVVPLGIVLAIMAAGWFAVHELNLHDPEEYTGAEADASQDSGVLSLSEAKLEAGRIDTRPVEKRVLQRMHTVPGRLRYDESKHISVKAPIAGILAESFVKPGDVVTEGQLLAVIQSPEIGKARAEVLRAEADLALIRRQSEWQQQIADNLARLVSELESGRSVDALEQAYAEKPLGQYRDQLLGNWAKRQLAEQLAQSARPLAAKGSIAKRTVQERETERQVAEAAYRTVRDQALFEAKQQRDRSLNEVADAERRLTIARNHLESLLGYTETEIDSDTSAVLSRLEVRAPFAGTIEQRSFAVAERVMPGDSLFVLADTRTLYVAANIRENDWPAIQLNEGHVVEVTAPALPDQQWNAVIKYVGRQVDVETNSVPLVATIDNESGWLRPGMFVRVRIPIGDPREAVAVSTGAVMQHENEEFVFVALNDRQFQRVDVATGLATDHWIEVTGGLQPGQRVVDSGAFLLKSELLLEGEE